MGEVSQQTSYDQERGFTVANFFSDGSSPATEHPPMQFPAHFA